LRIIATNKDPRTRICLHLPDAPAIQELEAHIDTRIRPYLEEPCSEVKEARSYGSGGWAPEDVRDTAVDLAFEWGKHFKIADGDGPGRSMNEDIHDHFHSLYFTRRKNGDGWIYDDWYPSWVHTQIQYLEHKLEDMRNPEVDLEEDED